MGNCISSLSGAEGTRHDETRQERNIPPIRNNNPRPPIDGIDLEFESRILARAKNKIIPRSSEVQLYGTTMPLRSYMNTLKTRRREINRSLNNDDRTQLVTTYNEGLRRLDENLERIYHANGMAYDTDDSSSHTSS